MRLHCWGNGDNWRETDKGPQFRVLLPAKLGGFLPQLSIESKSQESVAGTEVLLAERPGEWERRNGSARELEDGAPLQRRDTEVFRISELLAFLDSLSGWEPVRDSSLLISLPIRK